MIYFIKQNKISPIRIGIASNVEERIQKLQSGTSNKLVCLKVIQTENDQEVRQAIFDFFSNSRLNKSSWFSSTRMLLNFLDFLKDTQYYSLKQVFYFLNVAEKSVNKFKIKINVDQIKNYMQSLNYNQSQLAEKLGLTRQAISFMFMREQTSLFTVEAIAHALKCEVNEVIF